MAEPRSSLTILNCGTQSGMAPDRYTVRVTAGNQVIEKLVGLRRAELIQEPLDGAEGTSFYFRINNIPIFCYGSNWIPAHNFLTKLSNQDYYDWINHAVESNQNMIRVWGGGIYEPDEFYAECDRVGIMVWQDFMFACGQYPYYKEFRETVCREIKDQLIRLRNFCSIVIYAGNNEDYQIAEQFHLGYDPTDNSGDWTNTTFPARTAYETDMPKYVGELTRVPYHPGSPWGGNGSGDQTIGDNHQWNVWHGSQEKYQNWAKLASRFVSEFGMLAFPHRSTIDKCITDPEERYPQSIVMDSHCKADGFERRLALYVMENIKVSSMDMDSWIYATQLMQSECIAYAYRCWRREWRGDKQQYVAGALVWQLNDCWPVSSWALMDHYQNKKLSYYALKRECAPINVGIYRTTPEEKTRDKLPEAQPGPPHDLVDKHYIFDCWGVNSTLKKVDADLTIKAYNVTTGELVKDWGTSRVCLLPNQSTEFKADLDVDRDWCVCAKLTDPKSGQLLCTRAGDWPQPLKHLKMATVDTNGLEIKALDGRVEISCSKPVKGLALQSTDRCDEGHVDWQDNGIDVFPGENVTISAPGLNSGDHVDYQYYH